MKTLLITGGSGGHLIPALTLAEALQPKGDCVILSTSRPVDRTLAASSHVKWMTVDLQKFTPLRRWFVPSYSFRQFGAMRRVCGILRETRPDVVVGFGGYLSAVGVVAARFSGIPTVVHEQNLIPGKANRLLARVANAVGVSFSETKTHLPSGARVEFTGNPVRSTLKKMPAEQGRKFFGFDSERPVLLVMGGSQGSEAINQLVLQMWQELTPASRRSLQVLHLAGSPRRAEVENSYKELGMDARVFGFFQEMGAAYAAASLAISRAGATTIAEMTALEVPSILIPYPYAGAHQLANARWLEAQGGAVVLEESGLTPHLLWEMIDLLLSESGGDLTKMRNSLGSRSDGEAVHRLEALLEEVAG